MVLLLPKSLIDLILKMIDRKRKLKDIERGSMLTWSGARRPADPQTRSLADPQTRRLSLAFEDQCGAAFRIQQQSHYWITACSSLDDFIMKRGHVTKHLFSSTRKISHSSADNANALNSAVCICDKCGHGKVEQHAFQCIETFQFSFKCAILFFNVAVHSVCRSLKDLPFCRWVCRHCCPLRCNSQCHALS